MKYEITKDKEDLYVLVVNSIVVLISRDIDAVLTEIRTDIENRKTNPKRVYEPAIIDLKSPNKLADTPKSTDHELLLNL